MEREIGPAADSRLSIEGRTVLSGGMPAVRIGVADDFTFLGRLQFILSGVARVDSFVFAAGKERDPGQLLVIQFEGYLADNAYTYDYSFAETVTLDDRTFHTDTAVIDLTSLPPPDSDMGRVLALVKAEGYAVPDRAAVQRFVYLTDEEKRNELFMLYAEGLDDAGPELASWNEARRRALKCFTLRFLDKKAPIQ